jgi:CPA1 family monovalent cation:H+ antiporter
MESRQPAELRLANHAVWNSVIFLFNGLIFILIGLQLRNILEGLASVSFLELLGQAALVCLTVIVVRFAWVFPATYLPRYFSAKIRIRDPSPPWQMVVIIAWAGMRGVVSLAAALSLPLLTNQSNLFPQRNLVIFLTFSVILVTLVLQGLSLPLLIKWLAIPTDSGAEKESNLARLAAAQAGRNRLEELAASENVPAELLNRVRNMYDTRIQRYTLLKQGEFDESQQASFNQYQQWQKA